MKIHDLELFLATEAAESGDAKPHPTPLSAERPAPRGETFRLLVRVTTATGLEGWGEAGVGWRAGELAARRDALLAVLAGRSVYDIEELHSLQTLGSPALRAAVEMAVWDLLGRVLRQPLCNLWGGYYRRRVPVAVRLANNGEQSAAQSARELVEQGFHTLTLVSAGKVDEDIRAIKAVRELLGERIALRLDGRGLFNAEQALDLAAGLEYEGMEFVLDPLAAAELHPLAALGRQTSVPLASWLAILSPADVFAAARCAAARFVVVDPERLGGIVASRAAIAVAAAAGLTPLLGCRSSLGIATAAALHLAAALPELAAANEIAPRQLRRTVLSHPAGISEGMVPVPESPGLGITIDRAKLERHQPST
jgi:L-alanine-DL-glutamate epimerase-like enolase superfamily enzyme